MTIPSFKQWLETVSVQKVSQNSKTAQDWANQLGVDTSQFIQSLKQLTGNHVVKPETFLNQRIIDKAKSIGLINEPKSDPFGGDYNVQKSDARKAKPQPNFQTQQPNPYHTTIKQHY